MDEKIFQCQIIDWRITSSCNCKCEYCYASNSICEMQEEEWKHVLESIVLSGCQTVCISGGEPLLSKNAISIIKYLHSFGISIYLSTNGSRYMEYRTELEKYISKLSLPLDGYDSITNRINGRELIDSNDAFQKVIEILNYYKTHNHSFSIKIGTVLTNRNIDINHIKNMYSVIKQYPVDMWKIYELIPEANGHKNFEDLKISDKEKRNFLADYYEFLSSTANDNIKISFMDHNDRNQAYFIIQPNGEVILPCEKAIDFVEDIVIGDLRRDNINEVIKEWRKRINKENYLNNIDSRNISNSFDEEYADNIDKKILYILDKNPLCKNSDIENALQVQFNLSLSDSEIAERIDKLYRIRAIKHTMPIINISQFGLNVFLLNLYFKPNRTMNPERIADILCHDTSIAWVAECVDLNSSNSHVIFRVSIFARDNNELSNRINTLKKVFSHTLDKHEIDLVPDKYIFNPRFLINQQDSGMGHDRIVLNGQTVVLSKKEHSILLAMKYSKRLKIDDLSATTSYSVKQVNRIIDGLLSKAIINKFQIVFDTNVLGYQCYIIFIKFTDYSVKDTFETYVKKLINVSHINTLNTGKWDMDMELQVENPAQFNIILEDIMEKFGQSIRNKSIMLIKKEHKFRFLIDRTTQAIGSSVKRNRIGR